MFSGARLLLIWSALMFCAQGAQAQELTAGGKLLLTRGVTTVEGSGGGGLASWALVTGDETRDGVGGSAFATVVQLPDYQLRAAGAAVGLFDRAELSYARQEFDTEDAGAALGLGEGFTFGQDVWGLKVRVLGDAVYDQDRWTPQVAVGLQHKRNDQGAVVRAVGARSDEGTDVYVAATKLLLDRSMVVNGTVRLTKANQTGLLGFGGADEDYSAQFEGSMGWLLSRRVLVGGEYRSKPDNLGFAREEDWFDLFAAVAVTRRLSVTAAYADVGSIATFDDQRGLYLSLQAGF